LGNGLKASCQTLLVTALLRSTSGGEGKLDEVFELVLPGSEQFRLQQSRAIDAEEVFSADCAFLQQSGTFAIGQEPSRERTPTPITPLTREVMIRKAASRLLMTVKHYRKSRFHMSSNH
jgi:hypothetical protein